MEARWRALSEEVFTGMAACRVHHPRAMLGEIEAALDEWLATVQARMQPLLAQWNAQGANSVAAGRTLIVQPRAIKIRMIGGANRFFAGAFAGDSSIDMDLELKEAATGTVIAKPRIVRNANAMAGAWSVGATDRNLMDYIADIATQYLQDNRK